MSDISYPERRAAVEPTSVFDLTKKVILVTGGGRGLGLTLATSFVKLGAIVYCLDRLPHPELEFEKERERANDSLPGSLHYVRVDVADPEDVRTVIGDISSKERGVDGLLAAAGVQQITPALEYSMEDVRKMIDVNYSGVLVCAQEVAKTMIHYKRPGSIVFVASISGFVANKGLLSPVYNSSKAAVIQLGKNLAMEWGQHGIRVNSLCPGHIITPMVLENFREKPDLKEIWERENMLGRLSTPDEYVGAAVYLLSNASSFQTGGTLTVDGGHTAW
ncbi:MAG: hypothetical protein M1837_002371 [Sclerophora amabilis]|nr:MAG: hypothetical protein M1837_002371 [Sclerophora amabilis]